MTESQFNLLFLLYLILICIAAIYLSKWSTTQNIDNLWYCIILAIIAVAHLSFVLFYNYKISVFTFPERVKFADIVHEYQKNGGARCFAKNTSVPLRTLTHNEDFTIEDPPANKTRYIFFIWPNYISAEACRDIELFDGCKIKNLHAIELHDYSVYSP